MKMKPFLLIGCLCCISSFSWSQFMVMTAEGAVQGKFKAECTRSGYTDKTEVLGYSMEVKSPRDAATGQATGKRQYSPITIWKLTGASSAQFFKAITSNEVIKTLTLEFYKPDDVFKREELYYKIELTDVFISDYKQVMGTPGGNEELKIQPMGMYDEISLVFKTIKVTQTKGGISAGDDWQQVH